MTTPHLHAQTTTTGTLKIMNMQLPDSLDEEESALLALRKMNT